MMRAGPLLGETNQEFTGHPDRQEIILREHRQELWGSIPEPHNTTLVRKSNISVFEEKLCPLLGLVLELTEVPSIACIMEILARPAFTACGLDGIPYAMYSVAPRYSAMVYRKA